MNAGQFNVFGFPLRVDPSAVVLVAEEAKIKRVLNPDLKQALPTAPVWPCQGSNPTAAKHHQRPRVRPESPSPET